MIKETKTTKEHIVRHKFCDVCDTEIKLGLACWKAVCEYCGKDLCDNCVGYEEGSTGDYRIVYCKECWDKGNDYRPTIEKLHNDIDKLYDEWISMCKK